MCEFRPELPRGENIGRIAVRVKRKAVASVAGGHPWLFSDSVEKISGEGRAGDVAVLFDPAQKFIGAGLYDPASPVRVKIYSHSAKRPPVGPELFQLLAEEAAGLRAGKIPPDTDAWRLANGDSDGFPGLAADRYADALAVKFYSAALLPHAGEIFDAFAAYAPGISRLAVRLSRELQKLPADERRGLEDGSLFSRTGGWDGIVRFREDGIIFEADLKRGQKTGFFLDQRENRMRAGGLARGAKVLNVFSYSGGFSLAAAKGGAAAVTSVDLDPHAIALCNRNFELNSNAFSCPHEGLAGDAFAVLADLRKAKREYDLVIVDPPSFAKSAAEIPGALHSYGRLARDAVRLVRNGGTLIFASCSSRVDAETFFRTIAEAAQSVRRPIEIFDRRFHAADHPARYGESHYLKCLYARVKDETGN